MQCVFYHYSGHPGKRRREIRSPSDCFYHIRHRSSKYVGTIRIAIYATKSAKYHTTACLVCETNSEPKNNVKLYCQNSTQI